MSYQTEIEKIDCAAAYLCSQTGGVLAAKNGYITVGDFHRLLDFSKQEVEVFGQKWTRTSNGYNLYNKDHDIWLYPFVNPTRYLIVRDPCAKVNIERFENKK